MHLSKDLFRLYFPWTGRKLWFTEFWEFWALLCIPLNWYYIFIVGFFVSIHLHYYIQLFMKFWEKREITILRKESETPYKSLTTSWVASGWDTEIMIFGTWTSLPSWVHVLGAKARRGVYNMRQPWFNHVIVFIIVLYCIALACLVGLFTKIPDFGISV